MGNVAQFEGNRLDATATNYAESCITGPVLAGQRTPVSDLLRRETDESLRRVLCVDYDLQPVSYQSLRPVLDEVEQVLPELLQEEDKWRGVIVDTYPTMNRLYRDWKKPYRVCLHQINPLEGDGSQGVLHYHQWPSIVKIHKGGYKQGLAFGDPNGATPPIVSTMDLPEGSLYEMVDPRLWHVTIPTRQASWSTMVMQMGTWKTPLPITEYTCSLKMPPIPQDKRKEMFRQFREFYPTPH